MNNKSEIIVSSFAQTDLNYAMYLPESATSDHLQPLIIALHWGGPSYKNKGLDFLQGFALHAFRGLNAALLAPDCPYEDWSDSRSGKVVLDLLKTICEQYATDPSRILITGYSMGGIGSWLIAAENQMDFRGVLPIAARPPESVVDITWTIPIYIIHGERDEIFPINHTRKVAEKLIENGADVRMVAIEGTSHFETHRFISHIMDAVPWIQDRIK